MMVTKITQPKLLTLKWSLKPGLLLGSCLTSVSWHHHPLQPSDGKTHLFVSCQVWGFSWNTNIFEKNLQLLRLNSWVSHRFSFSLAVSHILLTQLFFFVVVLLFLFSLPSSCFCLKLEPLSLPHMKDWVSCFTLKAVRMCVCVQCYHQRYYKHISDLLTHTHTHSHTLTHTHTHTLIETSFVLVLVSNLFCGKVKMLYMSC